MTKRFFGALALAVVIAAPATATTEHDNDVFFALPGLESVTFTETGHDITSDQPYSGATASTPESGRGQITVKAGRKGSSDVADWFKTQVASGQTLACDSKDTFPDKLNFAVEGTLKMTVGGDEITCDNVIVAQGHFGTNNNWWMGGPDMQGVHVSVSGVTGQFCRKKGSVLPVLVTFSPQTPCVNNFNFSVISVPTME